MDGNLYSFYLKQFREKIMALPISDVKYDLYLLWLGLNNANNPYTQGILEKAILFADSFHQFHTGEQQEAAPLLPAMKNCLQDLITAAETSSYESVIEHQLLNLAGLPLGLGLGIAGAVSGLCGGMLRAIWHWDNPLDYSLRGFCLGFCIGAAIGNRSPHLLMDPVFRQIKFPLDNLENSCDRALEMVGKVRNQYVDDAIDWLLEYFDDDVAAFEAFISQEEITYDIVSRPAEFTSKTFRGYVGQHVMIKMLINNQYLVLEFTLDPANNPSDPTLVETQSETRVIDGQKLVEMLSWHLALQETDAFTLGFAATTFASGIVDCASYINKLLIGTGQEPPRFGRFHPSEKAVSYYVIGSLMEGLSPNPGVLHVDEVEEEAVVFSSP